ncbi:hypothetical protein K502DRAFT_324113 [Neoconidiobolus thromboides FSU 785]|nr:hypothetical protein K502DRAFT_324113 [Neoconidiobolus thromboides FSU 785]
MDKSPNKGQGHLFDDEEKKIDREMDDSNLSFFDEYRKTNPTESPLNESDNASDNSPSAQSTPKPKRQKSEKAYRRYNLKDMDNFFYLVNEKQMSIRGAARKLDIRPGTANYWYRKGVRGTEMDEFIEKNLSGGNQRAADKYTKLSESHEDYIISLYDENPYMDLDDLAESLANHFEGFKVSKSTLKEHLTRNCNLTLRRVDSNPIEKNSTTNIEKRYDWAQNCNKTDIDFNTNCVFIDEASFYINIKNTFLWSKKKGANSRNKTRNERKIGILGAISPLGIINVQIKTPRVLPQLKSGAEAENKYQLETNTSHYMEFIKSTLDTLSNHKRFRGFYIVMNNAPAHKLSEIEAYIKKKGYKCAYLPLDSPELNPMEPFWSYFKTKVRRGKLSDDETITTRIKQGCKDVAISDLDGFCKASKSMFKNCLEKTPL